jgi:hypothetical protein
MLTQIDFDGELKLLEPDEEPGRGAESLQERWAKAPPEDENGKYAGPERRQAERRQTGDRRELVRFQECSDRRSGRDRRVGIWDIKHTI